MLNNWATLERKPNQLTQLFQLYHVADQETTHTRDSCTIARIFASSCDAQARRQSISGRYVLELSMKLRYFMHLQ